MNTGPSGFGSLAFNESDESPSLNIFDPVTRDVSFLSGKQIPIYPTSLNELGPYEFSFPSVSSSYISLPSIRLFVEGKVVKNNGSALTEANKVSIADSLASSLFESCMVELNGKKVPELSSDNFHYKHFIEIALSYGTDAAKTQLKTSLKLQDEAGKYEDFSDETPLSKRKDWIANSKKFQAYTFLASDFMSCDRLFPSTNKLTIKLYRAKDDFVLIQEATDTGSYKIKITNIKLFARYLEIAPKIIERHLKQAETRPQFFPLVKSELKNFSQSSGSSAVTLHNIFTGALPKTVLVLFVKTSTFTGDKKTNPYNFIPLDCNYASLLVNGTRLPVEPYEPNIGSSLFSREYRSLFDDLSIAHENTGHLITPDLYKQNFFAILFNDLPDSCYHNHVHPGKTGNMTLELKFNTPPTDAFTVICFATYDIILSIDPKSDIKSTFI